MTAQVLDLPHGGPEIDNPSGIYPTEFNILLRPMTADKQFNVRMPDGSLKAIFKPDTLVDQEQVAATEGEIVAVSPLAFSYERWPADEMKPQVGDRIFFAKYAGMRVTGRNNVDYLILKDKDVAAVIRDGGDA